MSTMGDERLPPNNVEAEQSVLGSLLIDPDAIAKVAPLLAPEDFYREAHRAIYGACLGLYERHEPADFVTLCDALEKGAVLSAVGGPTYLASLINLVPTAVNVEHYAAIVRDCGRKRRLITAGGQIAATAYDKVSADEAVDAAEALLLGVTAERKQQDWIRLGDLLGGFLDEAGAFEQHQGAGGAVPTGFSQLDAMTGGLHPSQLVVLAGRPGTGKTSWAINAAMHAALEGVPVGVFSVEMSKEDLRQRIVCAHAGVDSHTVRAGRLSDEDWNRISETCGRLAPAPLWIDDTPGIRLLELRTKARRLCREQGAGLLIVDYLQLLQAGGANANRVQVVTEISQQLLALARELRVPVLALSQLNRSVESRPDHKPQLSDLRDSGAIEQDAHVVLFLYREEMYEAHTARKGLADVIVAKNRSGPTGEVTLQFTAGLTRFGDLEAGREAPSVGPGGPSGWRK